MVPVNAQVIDVSRWIVSALLRLQRICRAGVASSCRRRRVSYWNELTTDCNCMLFLHTMRPCKATTSCLKASFSAFKDWFCFASSVTVFWSSSSKTFSLYRLFRADLRLAARRRSFLSSSEARGPLVRVMMQECVWVVAVCCCYLAWCASVCTRSVGFSQKVVEKKVSTQMWGKPKDWTFVKFKSFCPSFEGNKRKTVYYRENTRKLQVIPDTRALQRREAFKLPSSYFTRLSLEEHGVRNVQVCRDLKCQFLFGQNQHQQTLQ